MTIDLVLHRFLKIKMDNALHIVIKMKDQDIFDKFDNFKISQSDVRGDCQQLKAKIDRFTDDWSNNEAPTGLDEQSNSMKDDIGRSIDFLQDFYRHFVKIDLDSFSMMLKSVSDQITEQVIRSIDWQLIQQCSSFAVGRLTSSISKRLQHHFVDEAQNSDSPNADQEKYEELLKKEDRTAEEIQFVTNYGKFRTFTEQINYNIRDHCDAYMQCEMEYFAGKSNNSFGSPDIKVQQTADNIRKGGPANIAVMIATAKTNDAKLKIVNDVDYVRTQENIKNGVDVICVVQGGDNELGHAWYMDSSGCFVETTSTGYDCFFAAYSKILEEKGIVKSVGELRAEAAKQIESNSTNYSKVIAAENWIKRGHPDSANALLFTAGLYVDGADRIKIEDADIDAIITAMDDQNTNVYDIPIKVGLH